VMSTKSVPEISLASRAMLCSLSICQWSARKHDPKASEEIAARHGAESNAGRYNKILLPPQALADVKRIVGEARREHYFMTLPWDDAGYRVLPAAAYLDHTAKLREYSDQFTATADAFAETFEQLVRDSRVRLGGLFRPADYPSASEIREKFSFETKVMPLPDENDFRVSLGEEETKRIQRQITATVQASLVVASRELWQRLYEAVSHLGERLAAYQVGEEGVEHPFRDTVVTNLVRLVEVLPKLNVTGDPELERLAEQVRRSLLVDPKELRQSEVTRNQTARAAAAIAQQMAGYMAGYQPTASAGPVAA
jgi:hypothetical protein